ncbi:hypothetical protein [Bosea minatitlanensis]|uniref:Uncharacterized protein n=1 Tax=Bosea minatitlanensis TaxID=128782 RepID=A0ABW0EXJ0_9HYPH|nr:hypothetical protein [Bosea minatitlanensis]MCT4492252.1 hypothetical protein [Bosea minatitlanensis]
MNIRQAPGALPQPLVARLQVDAHPSGIGGVGDIRKRLSLLPGRSGASRAAPSSWSQEARIHLFVADHHAELQQGIAMDVDLENPENEQKGDHGIDQMRIRRRGRRPALHSVAIQAVHRQFSRIQSLRSPQVMPSESKPNELLRAQPVRL